jgi:hypothetical protein
VPPAADLDGLGGVREVDAGGDGQDLQGADLAAAVSASGLAGGVRDGPPGQAGQLLVQGGLVAFDGQDPVGAAFGEVGDVITLAVQRVDGDHGVAQVTDPVEQRCEASDLVGLAVDVGAREDDAGVLVTGGEDVPGSAAAAA